MRLSCRYLSAEVAVLWDAFEAQLGVGVGWDCQSIRMLCILGCEVDLRQHAGDVRDDLVVFLLLQVVLEPCAPVARVYSGMSLSSLSTPTRLLSGSPFHAMVLVRPVDGIAGRLAATGIQAFAGQSGCAHILHTVAVAVAQPFDVRGLWLTGNVRARQVIGIVCDDLCKARLL